MNLAPVLRLKLFPVARGLVEIGGTQTSTPIAVFQLQKFIVQQFFSLRVVNVFLTL